MYGIAAEGRGPRVGRWRGQRICRGRGPLCAVALAAGLFAACGSRRDGDSPTEKRAAAEVVPAGAAAEPSLAALPVADDAPLGVASLDALLWRERGGQEAFQKARAAERRGDWAKMVAHCQEALAADASHLEASWLLAAGLSHLGRFAEVTAPLATAIAGDPGKWGQPALELSLFAPYWASGQGARLRPWIASAQRRFAAAVAGAVIAAQRGPAGKLLAYDRASRRWLPLSRRLALAGALITPSRVVFLARGEISAAARVKVAKAAQATRAAPPSPSPSPEAAPVSGKLGGKRAGKPGKLGPRREGKARAGGDLWLLGFVDRASGAVHEVQLPPAARYDIVERAGALAVRADGGAWLSLSADELLVPAASPPPATAAPRLVLSGGAVQVVRLPIAGDRAALPGIAADWDQSSMASALRLRRSNRLVALPAPALIDGQRVQWSPSSARLALVASLESCERDQPAALPRRTLAYVVDPITGSARELAASAQDLQLSWVSDALLAVATERGLELIDVTDGSALLLGAELSLPMPLAATRCAGAETGAATGAAADSAGDAAPDEPAAPEDGDAPLVPGDDLDDL